MVVTMCPVSKIIELLKLECFLVESRLYASCDQIEYYFVVDSEIFI